MVMEANRWTYQVEGGLQECTGATRLPARSKGSVTVISESEFFALERRYIACFIVFRKGLRDTARRSY